MREIETPGIPENKLRILDEFRISVSKVKDSFDGYKHLLYAYSISAVKIKNSKNMASLRNMSGIDIRQTKRSKDLHKSSENIQKLAYPDSWWVR